MNIWNKYIGSLKAQQIEALLEIKKIDPNVGLPFLENLTYDIPDDRIDKIIEENKPYFDLFNDKPEYAPLAPYQTLNVAFGFYSKGAIIGDAYGLGKTFIAGGIINLRKAQNKDIKVLVLTEKTAVEQVQRELIRITGLNFITTTGEAKAIANMFEKLNQSAGVVGTHSLLTNSEFLSRVLVKNYFTDFFLDESSIVKKHTSETTKNTRTLASKMDLTIFLNATPMELDIMELYNQLWVIDPSFVPSRTSFEKYVTLYDYRSYIPRKIGYKEKELNEMREKLSLRYNGYSRAMLFNYNIAEKNSIECIFVPATPFQKQLARETGHWMMAYSAPYLLAPSLPIDLESIPKLKALVTLFRERIGKKLTYIYCRYKKVHYVIKDILEKEGLVCEIINGDVTDTKKRNDIKDAFNNGEINVIISNACKALNLKSGEVCIFYSLETNPQKMKQIEGRIMREMQPEGREFYVIVTEKSEETRYMKRKMFRESESAKKVVNLDDGILNTCIKQITEHELNLTKG